VLWVKCFREGSRPVISYVTEDIKLANIVVLAFNLNPHILSQFYKFKTVHKVWLNCTFAFRAFSILI
jgi:hypothetical protein